LFGSAAADQLIDHRVTTDTQARFYVRADGYHAWGDGTNPQDTNFYRMSPGRLGTDNANIRATRSFASSTSFEATVSGDPQVRFYVRADGYMAWGDGTNPADVTLYRASAGILRTDDRVDIKLPNVGSLALGVSGVGDVNYRFQSTGTGILSWGDGTAALDTTLSRETANTFVMGTTTQKARLHMYAAAATDVNLNLSVGGEAQSRWQIRADGLQAWGPGGSTAQDITLARTNPGQLTVTGQLQAQFASNVAGNSFMSRSNSAVANSVLSVRLSGDAADRFTSFADGKLQWGDGTNPADTTLARGGAGLLILGTTSQVGTLRTYGSVTNNVSLQSFITVDTQPRFTIRAGGALQWSSGASASDVQLARGGIGILDFGSATQRVLLRQFSGVTTDNAFAIFITTDANPRYLNRADGLMAWGPGDATQDTNLYRDAADRLKTDDLFDATTMALASKVKAGAPVDADWAAPPPDGTIVADSTGSRLWVRIGGAWRSVAVA
jgi:hypothetical protein